MASREENYVCPTEQNLAQIYEGNLPVAIKEEKDESEEEWIVIPLSGTSITFEEDELSSEEEAPSRSDGLPRVSSDQQGEGAMRIEVSLSLTLDHFQCCGGQKSIVQELSPAL